MNLRELPGAELILPGIDDLHNGETNTVGSLLVAIAATRLTEAGLDIPKDCLAPPELTLYARLQDERDDAYSYYNAALLNELFSPSDWKSSVKAPVTMPRSGELLLLHQGDKNSQ